MRRLVRQENRGKFWGKKKKWRIKANCDWDNKSSDLHEKSAEWMGPTWVVRELFSAFGFWLFTFFFFLFAAVSHMYHVCTNTTKLQNQPGLTFFYNLMNSLSFGCFCFWMLSAVFKKSELLVAFFINFHACMYYCWIYFYFF